MKRSQEDTTHLYLTGYRGCGKSTIAKELARRLDLTLVDLDDVIESEAGATIADIFKNESEAGFRDRETECLGKIATGPRSIISLGGGAILRQSNREIISSTGWCVWLDAAPSEIAKRLSKDESTGSRRPSLTGAPVVDEIETVMREREPLYRKAAHLRIDTTEATVDEIVDEIVDRIMNHDPMK